MPSNLDQPFANLRLQNLFQPTNPIGANRMSPSFVPSQDPMLAGNPNAMTMTSGDQSGYNSGGYGGPAFGSGTTQVEPPDTSNRQADIYDQLIGQIPHRDKPSILRKIVASMAGASGGPEAASGVINQPHQERMLDWQTELNARKPLLDAEKNQNANERYMYSARLQNQSAMERAAETERSNRAREENNQQKTDISAARAGAYIWKQTHPNHQIQQDAQGNLIGINPADNTMEYILDPSGQPIKGRLLSQEDMLTLQHTNRMSEIGAQGANQRANTRVAGEEARKTEGVRQQGREKLVDVKDPAGKVVSQVIIQQDADGNIVGSRTTNTQTQPAPTKGPIQTPSNVTKIKMITADGRTVMMPLDKVKEAEQRGAKKAQ